MDDPIKEIVIRRVRLKDEHRPFEIHIGQLVEVDWLAVTHATSNQRDSFNLVFFRFDGFVIDWVQYDTLAIALDQAHAIAGVEASEWEQCNAEITNEDGRVSWEEVCQKRVNQ
ncbi:MAG: hypothetical protein WCO56_05815 [Verrucomicrobiota bacterium]